MKPRIVISCMAVGVVGAALTASAIEPVVNGSTYTFNVESGTETYSAGISGSGVTLVKTGAGKLTLTGAGLYSFSGTIEVREGTLAAAPECFLATEKDSLGKPDVVVSSEACLDCSGNGSKDWGAQVFGALTLSGSGPDGNGALIRGKPSAGGDFLMFSKMTLTDDATVAFSDRFRMCNYTGNGHTLTIKGGASTSWYVYGVAIDPGAGGSLVVEGAAGAQVVCQGAVTWKGDETVTNVLKTVKFITFNSLTIANSFVLQDGECSFTANDSANLKLTGPIVSSKRTIFTAAAAAVIDVEGALSMTDARFDTSGSGKVNFKGPVSISQTKDWSVYEYMQAGQTVFSGSAPKYLSGQIMGSSGKKLVFDGASYARLGGQKQTQLNVYGGKESPFLLRVTNSVLDVKTSMHVGTWAGGYGFVEIASGATVTNANQINLGGYNAGEHKIYGRALQTGGTFVSPGTLHVGYGAQNQGYYALKDGEVTASGGIYVGRDSGSGTFAMEAGSFRQTDGSLRIGYGGHGAFVQSGGYASSRLLFGSQAVADGTSGLILIEGAGTTNVNANSNFLFEPVNAYTGVLAINDGAYFRAQRIAKNEAAAAGSGHFTLSLDGGILAQTWSGNFTQVPGLEAVTPPDEILVHEKGVVLAPFHNPADDLQYADSYVTPFAAPTGKIVESIALPTAAAFASDTFYVGPPLVTISGKGHGAAAVATYDPATRTVTGIRVVAPGTGYDDSTTATIASSDNTTTYDCAVTVADSPTTGAGLTVDSAPRMVDLACANTYHGPTTVKSGTLRLLRVDAIPAGSPVIVRSGAILDLKGFSLTVQSLENEGVVSNGNLVVSQTLTLAKDAPAPAEHAVGTLTLANGATIALAGDDSGLPEEGMKTLLSAQKLICLGKVNFTGVPDGFVVRMKSNRIVCGKPSGMLVILK